MGIEQLGNITNIQGNIDTSGFTGLTKSVLSVLLQPVVATALAFLVAMLYARNKQLKNVKPISDTPLDHFPKYLDRFMLDGLVHGGGEVYFPTSMEMKLAPFPAYESLVESLQSKLQNIIQKNMTLISLISKEKFERGVAFGLNLENLKSCFFGIAKEKLDNYKKALRYVEKVVLSQKISNMDEKEIENAIKRTNYFLEKGLMEEKMKIIAEEAAIYRTGNEALKTKIYNDLIKSVPSPGEYRKDYITVAHGAERFDSTPEGFKEAINKHGGTETDLNNVEKFLDLEEGEDIPEDVRRSLEKAFFIPYSPKEIESLMLELAGKIKELAPKVIDRNADAVEAAAFVHQGIGNIHPFVDGHGRVARIWMNAMLQLGGYRAVAIPDKAMYMQATREDRKTPGTFAKYLKEVIAWNQQQEVLNDPANI